MSTSTTRPVTVRLTTEEANAVKSAAAALRMPVSSLFECGITDAAQDYGFRLSGADEPRRPPPAKPAAPLYREREESAGVRLCVSINPEVLSLLRRVSDHVRSNPTAFAIRSTLRYIAVRIRVEPKNKRLAAIKMPSHYSE